MLARIQLTLAGALLLVALALAGLLVFGGSGDSEDARVGPTGWYGALSPGDFTARDFTLRDQDGRPLRLASTRGEVTVVTFLYTTCQDTCPVMAQQIGMALDRDDTPAPTIAVSVDPRNDTEQTARAFLLKQRLTGRMDFALGTEPELAPIWKAYGVQPQRGSGGQTDPRFDHSTYVLLLDKRGRPRVSFQADDLTPEGLAHDLRKLQAEPV